MLLMVGATIVLYLSLMSSIKPQCINGRMHPVYSDCIPGYQ